MPSTLTPPAPLSDKNRRLARLRSRRGRRAAIRLGAITVPSGAAMGARNSIRRPLFSRRSGYLRRRVLCAFLRLRPHLDLASRGRESAAISRQRAGRVRRLTSAATANGISEHPLNESIQFNRRYATPESHGCDHGVAPRLLTGRAYASRGTSTLLCLLCLFAAIFPIPFLTRPGTRGRRWASARAAGPARFGSKEKRSIPAARPADLPSQIRPRRPARPPGRRRPRAR